MASQITGARVEYDPGAPLIDVDTAIEDLAEDLNRAGRRRQLIALQHLCGIARQMNAPWFIVEGEDGDGVRRDVAKYDFEQRVIALFPLYEEKSDTTEDDT